MFNVVRGKKEECRSHLQGMMVIPFTGILRLSAPVLHALYTFASSLFTESLLGSCTLPILPHHP